MRRSKRTRGDWEWVKTTLDLVRALSGSCHEGIESGLAELGAWSSVFWWWQRRQQQQRRQRCVFSFICSHSVFLLCSARQSRAAHSNTVGVYYQWA